MIVEPTPDNIQWSTIRIKAYASYAWPLALQSLCFSFILGFLVLVLIAKVDITQPYPVPITEKIQESMPLLNEEEFTSLETARYGLITPSRSVIYYE